MNGQDNMPAKKGVSKKKLHKAKPKTLKIIKMHLFVISDNNKIIKKNLNYY